MKMTFLYREKFSWGYVIMPLVSIAVIVYALSNPFNIRFKNLRLLEYPTSNYVVIGLCILIILYGIHKLLKMKAINSRDNAIITSENELAFKDLQGYSLIDRQLSFTNVNELWNKSDDEDGESMIIYSENSKNRYEFFAENFITAGEFADFKKILETQCINITNRGNISN